MTRRNALILLLCAMFAFGAAAKCFPPGTRVVIFMQGIYSTYDADGTQDIGIEDHAFDAIKAKFLADGYRADQLIDFSYNGGTVAPDGGWLPKRYTCPDTDRPAAQNLAVLEAMLRDYKARYPKVHFTLVGHSLGGYLAYLEGAREAARPPEQKLDIDVVVTLDAPLLGIDADKRIAVSTAISCAKTWQAGAEIVGDKLDPQLGARRQAEAALMAEQGVRLATLGNLSDCLYALARCTATNAYVDDTESQFLEGAALVRRYDIQSNIFLSHHAIFTYPQALIDLREFVGGP